MARIAVRKCQRARGARANLITGLVHQPDVNEVKGPWYDKALQRDVSMYWKFGTFDHGRSDYESQRCATLHGVSAGSHPAGFVRTEALKQIEAAGLSTDSYYSKSWEEFAKPAAPQLNFVFTVCDNAAKEICPVWPGQPLTAHWGVPDPVATTGTPEEIERAFRDTFSILDRRISLFVSASCDSRQLRHTEEN